MKTRFIAILVLFAFTLAGCYRSVPIAQPTIAPQTRVKLELTDRGSLELGPRIGNIIASVEGTVVESNDSTLTLALTLATDRRGIEATWRGEVVQFPRDYVARVSERKISKSRSWLLAAGIAAGALAAAGLGGSFGDGSSDGNSNSQ